MISEGVIGEVRNAFGEFSRFCGQPGQLLTFDQGEEAYHYEFDHAAQCGVRGDSTYEEMLADPEAEVVLNIITPLAHFALTRAVMDE